MEPLRWKCRKRRGLSEHCPIRCYETDEKSRAAKFSYGSHEGTLEAREEYLYDLAKQINQKFRDSWMYTEMGST